MARFGGEVGLDVRVTPANRWIEVHVTSGASATGTWATGKYCAREDGYATDCDPEAGIFSNRKADVAGVFPAAFVGLSVDLFRDIPVLHGMRLGATAAGGTYPYLGNEEEPGSSAWYGFGLDFSVAFGAQ